jgi:outer membrane protein W
MKTGAYMRILAIIAAVVTITASAGAQKQLLSGITWNMGFTTGRMAQFTDETSFSGFGVEFRRFTNDNVSFGGSFSWNVWSELTGETITFNQGAVSGTQVRYVNSFPLMLNAHYHLGHKADDFRPFFGLNAGTYYILQRLEIGTLALDNDNWHFGLAPEAGFLMGISRGTYIIGTVRYNYAFDSGESLAGKDDNSYSYWGVNIGISWMQGWF